MNDYMVAKAIINPANESVVPTQNLNGEIMEPDSLSGWIYVLQNSSIPGQLKIGKTTRPVDERSKELSSATGVPTKFIEVYSIFFDNCHLAEDEIHEKLELMGRRVNSKREFFWIEISEAQALLESMAEVAGSTASVSDKIAQLLVQADIFLEGSARVLPSKAEALKYFREAAALGNGHSALMCGYLTSILGYPVQDSLGYFSRAGEMGILKGYEEAALIQSKLGKFAFAVELWREFFDSPAFLKMLVDERVLAGRRYLRHTYWRNKGHIVMFDSIHAIGAKIIEYERCNPPISSAETALTYFIDIAWFEDALSINRK